MKVYSQSQAITIQNARIYLSGPQGIKDRFASLLADNGNSSSIDQNKKQQEIEKAANTLSEIFPRMIISQMFDAIDNDSEDGGFAQGMFRYLMVDEMAKEWVKNGTMDEVKNSIKGQLNKYEKARNLGESYK